MFTFMAQVGNFWTPKLECDIVAKERTYRTCRESELVQMTIKCTGDILLGENTLRCLALATIDKPLAKEKMDLETRDVTKYEVGTGLHILLRGKTAELRLDKILL